MGEIADIDAGTWLTYADLAASRGIDKQSAARLTFRRRWRRQKDNHGTVRVLVPREWHELSRYTDRDASRDGSGDESRDASRDMSRIIKPLEDAIELLREQLEQVNRQVQVADAARDRFDQALTAERARADELRSRLDDLGGQLIAAQEKARDVVDGLEAQLAVAREQAQAAQDAAEELRRAEAAREGKGRWARLKAAWRRE
jgi:chromosome segregation ATPase